SLMKFDKFPSPRRPRRSASGRISICALGCFLLVTSLVNSQEPLRDPEIIVDGLSKAVEENPADSKTRLMRGLYYFWTLFDFEKALEDFEKVIELDPTCAEAYIGRADVYTGSDARLYDPSRALKE